MGVSLFAQASLDHITFSFAAGMTGAHHQFFSIEMGSQKHFCPG
jgi:hypothetical protein